MTETAKPLGASPELRASLFHFFVFGSVGVASAYFAIWLTDLGIAPEQIGIINAMPVLLNLALNTFIGRLADRASDWRSVIVGLSMLAGVIPVALFFVSDFWGILLVWSLCTLPAGALVPVIDAATLRMTQRRGTDFGFIRAWGTVGYMVASVLTGVIIAWFGAMAFVPTFVALSLIRALVALPLPQFRAPAPIDAPVRPASGVKLVELVRAWWFILPCLGFAFVQATHFFLGAMGALVWNLQGIPGGVIGSLIAVGAAAEAVMMFAWRKVGRNVSARMMIIIAGVVGTLRWGAMALNPSLEVLFALQLLHGITLPLSYFGIMHFIANWAPEDIAAEAQGFSSSLTQLFAVGTLVLFGWLVGLVGGQTYFVAAAMTLIGAALAYWSMALRPVHSRAEGLASKVP